MAFLRWLLILNQIVQNLHTIIIRRWTVAEKQGGLYTNTSLQLMTRIFFISTLGVETIGNQDSEEPERRASLALPPSALIYFCRPSMRGRHTALASLTCILNLCKKFIKRLLDDYRKELTKFVSAPDPALRCCWNSTLWSRTYIFSCKRLLAFNECTHRNPYVSK